MILRSLCVKSNSLCVCVCVSKREIVHTRVDIIVCSLCCWTKIQFPASTCQTSASLSAKFKLAAYWQLAACSLNGFLSFFSFFHSLSFSRIQSLTLFLIKQFQNLNRHTHTHNTRLEAPDGRRVLCVCECHLNDASRLFACVKGAKSRLQVKHQHTHIESCVCRTHTILPSGWLINSSLFRSPLDTERDLTRFSLPCCCCCCIIEATTTTTTIDHRAAYQLIHLFAIMFERRAHRL